MSAKIGRRIPAVVGDSMLAVELGVKHEAETEAFSRSQIND